MSAEAMSGRNRGDAVESKDRERPEGLLKISELAEAAGVPAATIKHYRREGLLPEPVKTSRNMAWYQPESVERVRLIKRLQTERFMPLDAIRALIETDPDRVETMLDIEDRIIERAVKRGGKHMSIAEASERYEMPMPVLERLAEIGILSPGQNGYGPFDIKIIEAISRFRAGGYDEKIGFTVYDTLRYRRALEDLVAQEVEMVKDRLAGEVEPERVVDMLEAGAEPLEDLIAALHTKLLLAELEKHRSE